MRILARDPAAVDRRNGTKPASRPLSSFKILKTILTIDNGVLTISGERRRPERDASKEIRTYAQERFVGHFRRAVELPQGVDPTQASARYENGCLSISIGKHEASKPRAIAVA
jgi:HSP20 family molecular chaperone IbpA